MPTATPTRPWPVRLPPSLLERWRALARQEGVSPAMLVRLLMTRVLDGQEADVGLPVRTARSETGRLSIALRHDDLIAVRADAKKSGHSLAGWVRMLIQAKLKQKPIYTEEEQGALISALLQLGETSRKLKSFGYGYPDDASRREKEYVTLMALREEVREVHRYVHAIFVGGNERTKL